MVNYYLKAVVSLLVSLAVVLLQAFNDVYAGGVTGVEWLGLLAILLGPAGLVAALANTAFSPATKAMVQNVCAVAIVVVQGAIGVYAGGINTQEWIGIGLLLVSGLAVYVTPNSGPRTTRRSALTS